MRDYYDIPLDQFNAEYDMLMAMGCEEFMYPGDKDVAERICDGCGERRKAYGAKKDQLYIVYSVCLKCGNATEF